MQCSRRRRDVSQITGLQYIQTCFQMGGAGSHQFLSGAGDLLLLLVVMETIRGLQTVANEHIQGIVAALTRYQGIGEQVVVIQLKKF